MTRTRPLAETIHLTALGLWLGSIVMAGIAAANIFPTIKALDPRIPAYSGFTGDHWLIVAGQTANRIFVWADAIQFGCATLCIFTLGVLLFGVKIPLRRPSGIIRVVAVMLAVCVFGYYSVYLRTRMDLNMRQYWEAAQLGRNEEAAKSRQAFDADHPIASRLMGTIAITVLIGLVAGAWNAATPGITPPARPEPTPSRYEEPALARSRR